MLRYIYEAFLCIYVSYFLGCVNAAYYYATIVHDIDIRNFGSGNAGTTNILRVFGLRAAVIVLILDVFKGSAAILVAKDVTQSPVIMVLSAVAVITGHCLPVFIDFRGGKGIASTIGIFFAFDPFATLVVLAVDVLVMAVSGYMSLGSMVCMILSPAIFYFFGAPTYQIVTAMLLTIFTIYQHRENIKRLLRHEENKLDLRL